MSNVKGDTADEKRETANVRRQM